MRQRFEKPEINRDLTLYIYVEGWAGRDVDACMISVVSYKHTWTVGRDWK